MILRSLLVSAFSVVVVAGALPAGGRHLTLVKSVPASSATLVQAPAAITLWFSQKPNLKLTRVVLQSERGDTLKTRPVIAADSTGKAVRATIVSALKPGKYQVNWRTLSRDGHAVAGKFAFTIDSATKAVSRARSGPR